MFPTMSLTFLTLTGLGPTTNMWCVSLVSKTTFLKIDFEGVLNLLSNQFLKQFGKLSID